MIRNGWRVDVRGRRIRTFQIAGDLAAPLLTLEEPRVRNDDVFRIVSHR